MKNMKNKKVKRKYVRKNSGARGRFRVYAARFKARLSRRVFSSIFGWDEYVLWIDIYLIRIVTLRHDFVPSTFAKRPIVS